MQAIIFLVFSFNFILEEMKFKVLIGKEEELLALRLYDGETN